MPFPRLPFSALLLICLGSSVGAQDADAPRNLGRGLRQLAQWQARETIGLAPAERRKVVGQQLRAMRAQVQMDAADRVVVDAYLDGTASAPAVRARLEALGGVILNQSPTRRGTSVPHGVFSLRLPVDRGSEAARLPGVQSVSLVRRPMRRVGKATSQGVGVIKSSQVNAQGYTGSGITVGVLSDSYDVTAPHAAADVAADDLPGAGNPAGHTAPVVVLREGESGDPFFVDEGRALLQIVHDVAPGARLAFAAVGATQSTFADAIESLRTDPTALCDVLVDDIAFPDEPYFSDGIVAQAAQNVVQSAALGGRRVLFYSAAGNNGSLGYEAEFSPVSDALARTKKAGKNNLKLAQVPSVLTAHGFHNFTPDGAKPTIVQRLTVEGNYTELNFQWNDLFDPAKITAGYHLLVFDKAGNYIPQLSGIDDAFTVGQASQFADIFPTRRGKKVTYQIAIARGTGGTGQATHLRYIADVAGNLTGTFLQSNVPTVFGHSAARGVDAVAAYAYDSLALPEDFTSLGPVRIDFNAQGDRLAVPEERQQPTLAAPDGVDTSFFPPDDANIPGLENDTDESGFPNFFGTSAAAPHAAGVAALLLQAAGGPGSKTAAEIRAVLESTAAAHDLTPGHAEASIVSADGTVRITGDGDESNFSSANRNFFSIQYTGAAGTSLRSLTIDLSPAGLKFDRSAALGFPFTVGSLGGGVAKPIRAVLQRPTPLAGPAKLTLTFSKFPAGGTLTFGLDRDLALFGAGGNSADLLAGAPVTVLTRPATPGAPLDPGAGLFQNELGAGYSPASGFGLINAQAALDLIVP